MLLSLMNRLYPTLREERLSRFSAEVGRVLVANHLRLVTVESCTGGWIAQSLTSVVGSSAWYERGLVTYSNEAKTDLVGVSRELIAKCGAVSGPVVQAMARGALERSPADLALAVTGVAGPDGGTVEKPVGTVWVCWRARTGAERTENFLFTGDREAVRVQSVVKALGGLTRFLRVVSWGA